MSAAVEEIRTPYQILGGEEAIQELVERFYAVMDEAPEAATIRAMHENDLCPISVKLTAYLTEWLGGPKRWSEHRGGMCLTESHAPYPIGENERDEWLFCMNQALDDIGASDELKEMVRQPFFRVADIVRNQ